MAIVQRVNGDAQGVVNVDNSLSGQASFGKIISLGIGKHPTAFKITANANVAADMGVNGSVESVLRTIGVSSTLLMYQVTGPVVSVLVEATGFTDATLKTELDLITANVGGVLVAPFTVSSAAGFAL